MLQVALLGFFNFNIFVVAHNFIMKQRVVICVETKNRINVSRFSVEIFGSS